jgi:serine/threonine-protein kinase/endoribonuclease IRE1
VSLGISVDCLNQQGLIPQLQLLANGETYHQENFVVIVRYFVEKEIDLNQKDDLIEIVDLFIDNDIDINSKNKYDTNVLHYLCTMIRMIRVLCA